MDDATEEQEGDNMRKLKARILVGVLVAAIVPTVGRITWLQHV
jgi:hypothetical protein